MKWRYLSLPTRLPERLERERNQRALHRGDLNPWVGFGTGSGDACAGDDARLNYLLPGGGSRYVYTPVAVPAYNVLTTDQWLGVDCSGFKVVLTLPSTGVLAGQFFLVKDEKGACHTNNIEVYPGAGTMDGNAVVTMSVRWQELGFLWTGTTWSIF